MTESVKWCPLSNWTKCMREECALWVPKYGECAFAYIAEVAVQIKNLRELLEGLVEIRGLLELPPK